MPDAPQQPEATPRRPEAPAPTPAVRTSGSGAVIGPSITIRGEVSGDEDLLIQGKVDGSVDLELHAVTVGGEGRVKANITGRVVTVEGEVEGDLKARDQVILRSAAKVKGDITAPRVVLEDGANFRGLVDMGDSESNNRASSTPRATQGANGTAKEKEPEPAGKSTTSTATRAGKGNDSASAAPGPAAS